jgi:hypothetical protein
MLQSESYWPGNILPTTLQHSNRKVGHSLMPKKKDDKDALE